jgi:hypothetical protein
VDRLNNEIGDFKEVQRRSSLHANNPNIGLLVLAAAVNSVALAISTLEIRVTTKKPEGL